MSTGLGDAIVKQEILRIAMDDRDVPVTIDAEHGRFEVAAGGDAAFIAMRLRTGMLTLLHTEVPASMRGRGVGAALAKAALDYARDRQMQVEPYCPFVAAYIRRHPEYAALVPAGFQEPSGSL